MAARGFLHSFFKAVTGEDFPGLSTVQKSGVVKQQSALINALNILGVEYGVRKLMLFSGYTYTVPYFPNEALQKNPKIVRAVAESVSSHLKNVMLIDPEAVIAKGVKVPRRASRKKLGELLGYVSPGEQNGPLLIEMRIQNPTIVMFSYQAKELHSSQLDMLCLQRERMQRAVDDALGSGVMVDVLVRRSLAATP